MTPIIFSRFLGATNKIFKTGSQNYEIRKVINPNRVSCGGRRSCELPLSHQPLPNPRTQRETYSRGPRGLRGPMVVKVFFPSTVSRVEEVRPCEVEVGYFKRPFGKINSIHVNDRGWVFLEPKRHVSRFLSCCCSCCCCFRVHFYKTGPPRRGSVLAKLRDDPVHSVPFCAET